MLDLGPCTRGVHDWEKLTSIEQTGAGGDVVVRWCQMCGTVVVDLEKRGRVVRQGIVRQRTPEITRTALGLLKGPGATEK